MKKLVTKYFSLIAVLILGFCVAFGGAFPLEAQARQVLNDGHGGSPGGDPNDEQDFGGGDGGGGFDDDYTDDDGYWGTYGASGRVPLIKLDGYLILLLPSWDSSVPMFKIYLISDSMSVQGDCYAR